MSFHRRGQASNDSGRSNTSIKSLPRDNAEGVQGYLSVRSSFSNALNVDYDRKIRIATSEKTLKAGGPEVTEDKSYSQVPISSPPEGTSETSMWTVQLHQLYEQARKESNTVYDHSSEGRFQVFETMFTNTGNLHAKHGWRFGCSLCTKCRKIPFQDSLHTGLTKELSEKFDQGEKPIERYNPKQAIEAIASRLLGTLSDSPKPLEWEVRPYYANNQVGPPPKSYLLTFKYSVSDGYDFADDTAHQDRGYKHIGGVHFRWNEDSGEPTRPWP